MAGWRKTVKRIPGASAAYRWLRHALHPHYRAVRAIERAHPGQLLQPEPTTGAGRYPEILAFLAAELGGLPAPRVLSWGCSTGVELLALRKALPRAEIVGVEINPRSLAKAARATEGIERIRLVQSGDPADLAGEEFDAVLCLAVLRHARLQAEQPECCAAILPFARAEEFVSGLAALVRPGGLLALWNVHFRLADMAVAPEFAVALELAKGLQANRPLYGPGDHRMDDATCLAAVYRRKDDGLI